MKRSGHVPASLTIALSSLAGSGCGPSYYEECVDSTGKVIASTGCRSGSGIAGAHWVRRSVSTGGFGSGSSGGFSGS